LKEITVPEDTYYDKIYQDVSVGNAPDLANFGDQNLAQFIDAGLLEPLDDYIEKAGFSVADWVPAANLAKGKDGKTYAVIFQSNPRALVYNKEMLEAANLTVPTNLDEFLAAVRALRNTEKQTFGFVLPSKPGEAAATYFESTSFFKGFGADYFRDGKPSVDTPEMKNALRVYKSLYDEGLIPRGVARNDYRQLFARGKIAMYVTGPFVFGMADEIDPEVGKQLQATTMPFPGGKTAALTVFLGVPKDAQNKQLATDFLMLMLEDKWQRRNVELVKVITARRGMAGDFAKTHSWYSAFEKAAETAESFAPAGFEKHGSEIAKIVSQRIEVMLSTNASADETAVQMQADLEEFAASAN